MCGVPLLMLATASPALVDHATAQTATSPVADPRSALLAAQDARVATPAHRDAVTAGLAHERPEIRVVALRAIARTQRAEFLDAAIDALIHASIDVRREAAFAVAHIAVGSADAAGRAEPALRAAIARERDALVFGALVEEYGRLPFADATALDAAARVIQDAFVSRAASPALPGTVRLSMARAAEAMARRSVQLRATAPAVLGLLSMLSETSEVVGTGPTRDPVAVRARRLALGGLLTLDSSADATVDLALRSPDAQTRRLGVLALARRGVVDAHQAQSLLEDDSVLVRHAVVSRLGAKMPEVARAAVADAHVHVRLAALQALGEARACRQECASRLAGAWPAQAWHEPAAALVALARTDPRGARPHVSRAAIGAPWQRRMYVARAAALTRQADVLATLARDPEVNVRHAALVAWREAGLPDLAAVALGALASDDGQLVLEAATALKGTTPTPQLVRAVRATLSRLTAQRRETSRDPRLALLERVDELDPQRTETLRAWLTDFDPAVAARAAALLAARLGPSKVQAAPRPLPSAAVPTWDEVVRLDATNVVLTLTDNRTLTLRLFARNAPTAVARLVAQVRAGEWNGRTFHRVEPGFVIQGGSPAANEYAGASAFARDEFSRLSHVRGTIGISTRGPDTGDGQIFVNLVDNVRLDYGFTLVGAVTSDPSVLDDVLEGEVIVSAVAVSGARQ